MNKKNELLLLFRYGNAAEEKAAAEELQKEEKQINEQNEKFKEGKSTFFEALNEFSDIPPKEFEKEMEGELPMKQ